MGRIQDNILRVVLKLNTAVPILLQRTSIYKFEPSSAIEKQRMMSRQYPLCWWISCSFDYLAIKTLKTSTPPPHGVTSYNDYI